MRRYASPDAAVRDWAERRSLLTSPRSLDLSKDHGLVYGEYCEGEDRKCLNRRRWRKKLERVLASLPPSARPRKWIEKREKPGLLPVPTCARCGAPWPVRDEYRPPGQIQSSRRRGGADDRLAEIGTIGRLLQVLSAKERAIYLGHLGLPGFEGEAANIGSMSAYRVRETVSRARAVLRQAMRRAGLLEAAR